MEARKKLLEKKVTSLIEKTDKINRRDASFICKVLEQINHIKIKWLSDIAWQYYTRMNEWKNEKMPSQVEFN